MTIFSFQNIPYFSAWTFPDPLFFFFKTWHFSRLSDGIYSIFTHIIVLFSKTTSFTEISVLFQRTGVFIQLI